MSGIADGLAPQLHYWEGPFTPWYRAGLTLGPEGNGGDLKPRRRLLRRSS